MNEKVFKIAHVDTWNFIIKELLKAYHKSLEENGKHQNVFLINLKIKSVEELRAFVQGKKEDYYQVIKFILKDKKRIANSCWACQFATTYQRLLWVNRTICRDCPLLEKNGGKLKVECNKSNNICSKIVDCLQDNNFTEAIKLSIEVRDSWREING